MRAYKLALPPSGQRRNGSYQRRQLGQPRRSRSGDCSVAATAP